MSYQFNQLCPMVEYLAKSSRAYLLLQSVVDTDFVVLLWAILKRWNVRDRGSQSHTSSLTSLSSIIAANDIFPLFFKLYIVHLFACTIQCQYLPLFNFTLALFPSHICYLSLLAILLHLLVSFLSLCSSWDQCTQPPCRTKPHPRRPSCKV